MADDGAELAEYWNTIATHTARAPWEQVSDFGTRNCRVCGMPWKSAQVGDGPATIRGCPERIDAELALYEASVWLRMLIPPQRHQ
jgi:hypothetical protein